MSKFLDYEGLQTYHGNLINRIDSALDDKADKSTTYTKTEIDTALASKADITDIPTVPITAIQKNGTGITPVSGTVNITVPTTAADVSALPNTTKYATALSLTINSSTFVMTGQLKDQNGDNLGTAQTIDLPLESVVVGGSYNSQTQKVVLTLQNGNTVEFSVADLVSGLQTELSASNKLNPAYINYDSTHRAVSDAEKSAWNGKQNALTTEQLAAVNSGITAERLEDIGTSLNNKVDLDDVDTALSSSSTNPVQNKVIQAPVARLVDAGAKNLLKSAATSQTISGVTFTVESTGEITISGTASSNVFYYIANDFELDASSYIVNVPDGSTTNTYYIGLRDSNGQNYYLHSNNRTLTLAQKTQFSWMRIAIYSGYVFNNLLYVPMICTTEDYAISPAFVPYAMNNRELTEAVEPVPRLVDAGAKNLMDFSQPETVRDTDYSSLADGGVHLSCSNKTWTQYIVSVPVISGKNYTFAIDIANVSGDLSSGYIFVGDENGNNYYDIRVTAAGKYVKTLTATTNTIKISVYINNSATAKTVSLDAYGMLCTMEDYNVSPEFVPYAKSNYELTVTEDEDRASLVELVDGGAKNLLEVPTTTVTNNGVQFTISNGVITATILSETRADAAIFNITDSLNLKENEEYIFMVGLPSGASGSTYFYDVYDASWANRDVYSITRALESSRKRVRFVVAKEYTGAVGTTIIAKPMICSKVAWKISQTYQPYRKSLAELTVDSDDDRAALVELVDGGAKNIAAPLDVASRQDLTITNDNGQYTITGTITSSFTGYLFRPAEPLQLITDCIIIGAEQLTGLVYLVAYRQTAGSNMKFDIIGTQNKILPSGAIISYIYVQQNNAETAISAKINLMLCTVADYAISPKFVPYRPSYQELYERVETNKSNILSLQNSRGVLSDATTIIDTDWTLTTIKLIAPVNRVVNMTAVLIYGTKAPRGIRITRSNTSPTTGVIANIEVSDDELQIITQAVGVKLNGINTYYVWAKAKEATTNVPAYLIYEIY